MQRVKQCLAMLLVVLMVITMMPQTAIANVSEMIDGTEIIDDAEIEDTEEASTEDFNYQILEDGTVSITRYLGNESNNLVIPSYIKGKPVTQIGNGGFSSGSFKRVVLPDTIIIINAGAFAYCDYLESIELPKKLKVLDSSAFYGCGNLESIFIPKTLEVCKTSEWTSESPFSYSGLKTAIIEDGMEKIPDYLFAYADELERVEIPDSVVEIGTKAFVWCDSLKSITIPDSVRKIGAGAFECCESLKTVDMSRNIQELGYIAFSNCKSLESIFIPKSLTSFDESLKECESLVRVEFEPGVTQIFPEMFMGCHSLDNVVIPEGVIEIGDSAFHECWALSTIELPDSLQRIGAGAFNGCGFTEITVPSAVEELGSGVFAYCGSLEKVIIPGSVQVIQESAFWRCEGLTSVILLDGIKTIEEEAFWECKALEEIAIPDSVTSIGEKVFKECKSLRDVTLGRGITVIPKNAFENCDSLVEFFVPYSVKEIQENAFYEANALAKIHIPDTVTTIGKSAFYKVDDITIYGRASSEAEDYAIDHMFPFVEEKVVATQLTLYKEVISLHGGEQAYIEKYMEPLFVVDDVTWKSSNEDVATVDENGVVTAWKTGSTTITFTIGELSQTCTVTVLSDAETPRELPTVSKYEEFEIVDNVLMRYKGAANKVVIPDGVYAIADSAFAGNGYITSVVMPESVISIGDEAFTGCAKLVDISIPKGLKYFGKRAFAECTALERITIALDDCTIGAGAFNGCSSLKRVTISEGVKGIGEGAFANCDSLASVEIPSGVTEIAYGLFAECDYLEEIVIPESVTAIGYRAFYGTRWLAVQREENTLVIVNNVLVDAQRARDKVVIPDGITCIAGGAFYKNNNVKSVVIPNEVTDIDDYAFYYCEALKTVNIPDSITHIGKEAFMGSLWLLGKLDDNSLVVENGALIDGSFLRGEVVIPDGVRVIADYAFYKTSSTCRITSVNMPESVDYIGDYAFYNCSSLVNVNFPETLSYMGDYVFSGCKALISANIPNGITEIGDSAFYLCTELASVVIPESVTKIDAYAFAGCRKLSDVILPDGVTEIGESAFASCMSLTKMTIPESVEVIREGAFANCTALGTVELHEGLRYIDNIAFGGCKALYYTRVPKSVVYIGEHAFDVATSIIGESTILIVDWGSYAHQWAQRDERLYLFADDFEPTFTLNTYGEKVRLGKELIISATVVLPEGASTEIIWKSSNENVATVDKNGKVTPVSEGSATITATLAGDKNYVRYCDIIVLPALITIKDEHVSLSQTEYIYNGRAKKPTVVIKIGDKILKERTDYVIEYRNNTAIGTASVAIKGKGDYEGFVEKKFIIKAPEPEKISLQGAIVRLSQTVFTYDGKMKTPNTVVQVDGKVLEKDKDYTVSYANNIKVGTAIVTITGIGKYKDSMTSTFVIKAASVVKVSIKNASVKLSATKYSYDGKAKRPSVTVNVKGKTLKRDVDYTVNYKNNKNIGTATVTITGKGNYEGTISKTFTINLGKGKTFKSGAYQYKVTGTNTVAFAGINSTKTTTVKIADTVKYGGKTFKVTSIADKALRKKTKVKKVTIGKNVTTIGKSAFEGCKKLKTIIVKSTKLKSVGKNAFKSIYSKATIKVPSGKLKAYQKLMKSKGQGSKVKIKK